MKPLVATRVEITDTTPKWGIVQFVAPDDSVEREYMITGEQERDVALRGALPPGCTIEEWITGRVHVHGMCLNPTGQAFIESSGWLCVSYGRSIKMEAGVERIKLDRLRIPPHEWRDVDGVIHIREDVAALISGS